MQVNFRKSPQGFLLEKIFPLNKDILCCHVKDNIDLLQFLPFWKEIKEESILIVIISSPYFLEDLSKYNIKILSKPLSIYNFLKEVSNSQNVSKEFSNYLRTLLKKVIGHKYKGSRIEEIKLRDEIKKIIDNRIPLLPSLRKEIENIIGYLPEDKTLLYNLLIFLNDFLSD